MSKIEFIKYGNIQKGVIDGQKNVVTKICAKVAAQAKALAPVDTGNLRGSIGYEIQGQNTSEPPIQEKPKQNEGYVGSYINYALYQEYGTRKMAAQPYLRPAIEIVNGGDVKNVMKKAMDETLKGALKNGVFREEVFLK